MTKSLRFFPIYHFDDDGGGGGSVVFLEALFINPPKTAIR
jgi:hypothetical protein